MKEIKVKIEPKQVKQIRKQGINVNAKKSYPLVGYQDGIDGKRKYELYLSEYDVTMLLPVEALKFSKNLPFAELAELYKKIT